MSVFRFQSLGSTRKGGRSLALFAAMLVACNSAPEATPAARDDLGDPLPPFGTHLRIVSLIPATTEILFALGAGDKVVGRTRWDGWPPEALQVPDLGDGIRPSIETVLSARPDLVVLYASGDNRDAAAALRSAGIAVISLRIDSIAQFERATLLLGNYAGAPDRARAVVDSVRGTLERVRAAALAAAGDSARPTVFMLAWETPLMTIGSGSFLSELVDIAGGRNVFGDLEGPSPQIAFEEVLRRDPRFILGRPETAGKLGASERWRQLPAVREGRVLVMDTVIVGRPGVRLGEAAVSIARLLHPGIKP
jgi:iron complex transport system substrate-binding protein